MAKLLLKRVSFWGSPCRYYKVGTIRFPIDNLFLNNQLQQSTVAVSRAFSGLWIRLPDRSAPEAE
jgi:hypothetical protein